MTEDFRGRIVATTHRYFLLSRNGSSSLPLVGGPSGLWETSLTSSGPVDRQHFRLAGTMPSEIQVRARAVESHRLKELSRTGCLSFSMALVSALRLRSGNSHNYAITARDSM